MRHDPLYIPAGPIDDAPTSAADAERYALAAERDAAADACDAAYQARVDAASARDGAALRLAALIADGAPHSEALNEYKHTRDAHQAAVIAHNLAVAAWYEQCKHLGEDDE